MSLLKKIMVQALKFVKKFLDSSPQWRLLLYDLRNEEEFANLYEHEKMLADTVRIDCYRRAIQKYIGPNDVVLDLGTGTGILAFFAARQNPKKIFAIDHSDFIEIARETARHNNIGNVEFIQSNSRSFTSEVLLDVIIHEQIGDYLFNENMLENILDLKKRLLKHGGRILPGKFELYLEPASLNENFKVPFIWENRIDRIDFAFLRNHYPGLEKYKPSNYQQEWLAAAAVKHFLCKRNPILAFDLNQLNSESEISRSMEISKQVTNPGSFDGCCLFFKVIFDEEINFHTSPLTSHTHWGNCFFRIESHECFAGETITFKFTLRDHLDIKTWTVTLL